MHSPFRILHLEDDRLDAELIRSALAADGLGCSITHVRNRGEFVAALDRGEFDAILADHHLPGFDGLTALKLAREKCQDIPFIFLSGTMDDSAVSAMLRGGATDHVPKDDLSRLSPAVARAMELIGGRRDRRRDEEKLREQAALLDMAADAIFVRDLDHRITYWNKSAERIFGWTAVEAVGRSALELLVRKDGARYLDALESVIKSGEWSGELTHVSKAGVEVTVQSRWTLVRDAEGLPKSMLVINSDITERKALESQFLRAQRLESIGALASGIAHDLNNVLAPILMSVGLLDDLIADATGKKLLETVRVSAWRGAEMVKQILAFTRGVAGHRDAVQLQPIIAEIARILRETLPRDIQICTSGNTELWPVLADTTQFHQVLMNLCVNARDAMPEGGVLSIHAENVTLDASQVSGQEGMKPGRYLELSVADTGTGIAPESLAEIWDPYFSTKAPDEGTGLGLPTVQRIVQAHGGFITVESQLGKGTRFRTFLPATEALAPAVCPDPVLLVLPRGRGEKILIVDDELAFQEITRAIFSKFGYQVLTASDGSEAVAMFAEHKGKIDLVVTDMMMPVLDGVATIRELRRMDPNVRIIAASGLSENEVMTRGFHDATFLLKPFSTETLLRTVDDKLRGPLAA